MGCPTPNKKCFPSMAAAKLARKKQARAFASWGVKVSAIHCECNEWHLEWELTTEQEEKLKHDAEASFTGSLLARRRRKIGRNGRKL